MTTEEWLKDQCNRYGSTGECSCAGCLKRGGYVRGTIPVDYSKATCHAHEALKEIDHLHCAVHAAHGLLAPLGSQPIPSVMAIREALSILRRHS